jgi:hypothetical protein
VIVNISLRTHYGWLALRVNGTVLARPRNLGIFRDVYLRTMTFACVGDAQK